MRKFHILAAFDRFNYGDLLFGHLAAAEIRARMPKAEINYYGTRHADLSVQGGFKTRPLTTLFHGDIGRDDIIWVAGGEVLSTRWVRMAEHNMPHFLSRQLRRVEWRIGRDRTDWLCRRMLRAQNLLPWILDPAVFPKENCPTVVYSSVGGRGIEKLSPTFRTWAANALNRASYLSVRDTRTQTLVEDLTGHAPALLPDSAVVMDQLHGCEESQAAFDRIAARMEGLPSEYIAVQTALKFYASQKSQMHRSLQEIHRRTGRQVVLFSIGRASGHEDQIAAQSIYTSLGKPDWLHLAPDDTTVWEIMALIARSQCYVGTSLHGFITAFVFAVPRVGLSPHVGKLTGFRDAWDLEEMPAAVPFDEIAPAVNQALKIPVASMLAQRDKVQAISQTGTDGLWKIVASG